MKKLVLLALLSVLSIEAGNRRSSRMVGGPVNPTSMDCLTQTIVEAYFDKTFMKSRTYQQIKNYLKFDSKTCNLYYSRIQGTRAAFIPPISCIPGTIKFNSKNNMFSCKNKSKASQVSELSPVSGGAEFTPVRPSFNPDEV